VDVLQWAIDPRGHRVPIHIAWSLIEVAFVSAVAFLIVHAAYIRFFAGEKQWSGSTSAEVVAAMCEACGTSNDADARFCKECGTKLARGAADHA